MSPTITIGNHDHNATRPESDYEATTDFVANFGPTDYSFNRGDVHIISMDNVVGINSTGSTWKYNAGFSDLQYAWLQQDIALVPEKDRKMVFICCHIPFRGGATSGGSSVNRDNTSARAASRSMSTSTRPPAVHGGPPIPVSPAVRTVTISMRSTVRPSSTG